MSEPIPACLILSGGLGLGAYQAGVMLALHASGHFRFELAAASSIGALNAAVFFGGAPETAPERLTSFWDRVATEVVPTSLSTRQLGGTARHVANWTNTLTVRLGGARGLFAPRLFPNADPPGLYDAGPATETLADIIDYTWLNSGQVRLCIAATDVETAEPVSFDTAAGDYITIDHLLASSALLPAFPRVRIGDRLLGDGGFSMNAPLEPVLSSARRRSAPPSGFLVDLFSGQGVGPRSLERAAERAEDLMFANQTNLRLEAIVRERQLEARLAPDEPGTDLIHLRYPGLPHEAGPEKTYDFSRGSIMDRIAVGRRDGMLASVAATKLNPTAAPGLRVHSFPESI